MSDRATFLSVLAMSAKPSGQFDAIVVLCGEDGQPRLEAGVHLFKLGLAPTLVLSGGKSDPPRVLDATTLHAKALGMGVAPDRIVVEGESQNTREQALNVVDLAYRRGWRRLIVCASPYHLPRAFLSFVQALREWEEHENIQLVPMPATHVSWFAAPDGSDGTNRVALLGEEFTKIAYYHREKRDVASYEDGLAYLNHWSEK